MKRLFVGVLLSFLIISFSGCQETPKEDYIKNKKEQDLEQAIKASGKEEEVSSQTAENFLS